MLKAPTTSEKWPRELTEVTTRLEMAEQLRPEETTQKQALQEAFETERNKLLNETASLTKRATTAENTFERLTAHAESKGRTKDLKPDGFEW